MLTPNRSWRPEEGEEEEEGRGKGGRTERCRGKEERDNTSYLWPSLASHTLRRERKGLVVLPTAELSPRNTIIDHSG